MSNTNNPTTPPEPTHPTTGRSHTGPLSVGTNDLLTSEETVNSTASSSTNAQDLGNITSGVDSMSQAGEGATERQLGQNFGANNFVHNSNSNHNHGPGDAGSRVAGTTVSGGGSSDETSNDGSGAGTPVSRPIRTRKKKSSYVYTTDDSDIQLRMERDEIPQTQVAQTLIIRGLPQDRSTVRIRRKLLNMFKSLHVNPSLVGPFHRSEEFWRVVFPTPEMTERMLRTKAVYADRGNAIELSLRRPLLFTREVSQNGGKQSSERASDTLRGRKIKRSKWHEDFLTDPSPLDSNPTGTDYNSSSLSPDQSPRYTDMTESTSYPASSGTNNRHSPRKMNTPGGEANVASIVTEVGTSSDDISFSTSLTAAAPHVVSSGPAIIHKHLNVPSTRGPSPVYFGTASRPGNFIERPPSSGPSSSFSDGAQHNYYHPDYDDNYQKQREDQKCREYVPRRTSPVPPYHSQNQHRYYNNHGNMHPAEDELGTYDHRRYESSSHMGHHQHHSYPPPHNNSMGQAQNHHQPHNYPQHNDAYSHTQHQKHHGPRMEGHTNIHPNDTHKYSHYREGPNHVHHQPHVYTKRTESPIGGPSPGFIAYDTETTLRPDSPRRPPAPFSFSSKHHTGSVAKNSVKNHNKLTETVTPPNSTYFLPPLALGKTKSNGAMEGEDQYYQSNNNQDKSSHYFINHNTNNGDFHNPTRAPLHAPEHDRGIRINIDLEADPRPAHRGAGGHIDRTPRGVRGRMNDVGSHGQYQTDHERAHPVHERAPGRHERAPARGLERPHEGGHERVHGGVHGVEHGGGHGGGHERMHGFGHDRMRGGTHELESEHPPGTHPYERVSGVSSGGHEREHNAFFNHRGGRHNDDEPADPRDRREHQQFPSRNDTPNSHRSHYYHNTQNHMSSHAGELYGFTEDPPQKRRRLGNGGHTSSGESVGMGNSTPPRLPSLSSQNLPPISRIAPPPFYRQQPQAQPPTRTWPLTPHDPLLPADYLSDRS